MKNDDFINGLNNHIKNFSIDTIINELPKMLNEPCTFLVDENEKEVFLIGAIGVISGLLPNIRGLYSGKWIAPNLFVYVLAGYGGGKGSLDYARALGKQIHKAMRDDANKQMLEYLKDIETYKKLLKEFNKTKEAGAEPPTKPSKPPTLMLFIPANNSKSGVYQLLEENDGRGIMFESEGDTLADALKQDYGGFSDTLRQGFHHETISLFRRMNNELIEINNPEISVVLSSTFNQLKTLIPSIENGLFSRFLFYELKQNNKFINVFDNRKKEYQQHFDMAGIVFKDLFDELNQLQTPIWFWLTEEQQQKFVELFDKKKSKLIDEIDITMSGTANRLGIIAFRVMMIFTVLRAHEAGTLNNSIRCSDADFNNALAIIDRLEKHAKTVYDYLDGQPEKKKLAGMLFKEGKSYGEISNIIYEDGNHKGTIHKWLNKK
jgi:hypothetical protein